MTGIRNLVSMVSLSTTIFELLLNHKDAINEMEPTLCLFNIKRYPRSRSAYHILTSGVRVTNLFSSCDIATASKMVCQTWNQMWQPVGLTLWLSIWVVGKMWCSANGSIQQLGEPVSDFFPFTRWNSIRGKLYGQKYTLLGKIEGIIHTKNPFIDSVVEKWGVVAAVEVGGVGR